jgi:broad specificity phosphatase PhoE/membrane protein DedA with SNARE-associated domain
MTKLILPILTYLEVLATKVPLEIFTIIGSFLEEVIAPIPSPFVLTTAGSITRAQDKALIYILMVALLASIAKTLGAWFLYIITDKLEDVFIPKFGKFFGIEHENIEKIGKYFNGTKRDWLVLFALRSIPIMPSSPISITCGFIKLDKKNFIVSTFFGTIIRSLFFLYLGYTGLSASESLINGLDKSETIMQIVVVIGILALLVWGYKQRSKLITKSDVDKEQEAKDLLNYKRVDELPKEESDEYPTIYIFRHGQTEDNKEFIFSGWRESKLTEEGKKQAEILAEKIKNIKFDRLISSPQIRAIETMKYAMSLNESTKNLEIENDERIKERSYGDFTGKSKLEIQLSNPEELKKIRRDYDYIPPNGESIDMVCTRVSDFCDDLVAQIKGTKVKIAISCHGNSMRGFRKYFENLSNEKTSEIETPLGQDYAAYVIKD